MIRVVTALVALVVATPLPAVAVTIDTVYVGDEGNLPDPATGSLFGSVPYAYRIGKYEVTNNQYAEFLNLKDPTGANPLGLYATTMSNATYGGISFNAGNPEGAKYTVKPGDVNHLPTGNHPVNYVTWYNAVRFANWLHNGQGLGDTEDGAYTLLGGTPIPSNALTITRNPGATWFIPSEDEWYKAAYYNPADGSYFLYPTSHDWAPITGPAYYGLPNSANYAGVPGLPLDVGLYTGSASPYGTFDQGGNVAEWNEALLDDTLRGARGGSFDTNAYSLSAQARLAGAPQGNLYPQSGFRVAAVPEPSTVALAALGVAALAVCRRRRHARYVLHDPARRPLMTSEV